jgi:predicted XRE-type DNA-binding protein
MEDKEPVTYSSKSAFHALDLPDADDLELRASLMQRIGEIVTARGLTQVQAGEFMAMDQPLVSALLRGKIGKFSTDRLLKALSDLGQDVELRITPAPSGKGKLRLAS